MRRPSRYVQPPRDQFSLFDATVQLRDEEAVSELPASMQELVDVIGLGASIDLVRCCGGDELKIPEVADGTSRVWALLVETIGGEKAALLVDRYKGTPLYIAKCEGALRRYRNQYIIDRIRAGEDFATVRRESGITRRHLFRLLASSHRNRA